MELCKNCLNPRISQYHDFCEDCLDNEIDKWHGGAGPNLELYEYLEMDYEDYKKWVENFND